MFRSSRCAAALLLGAALCAGAPDWLVRPPAEHARVTAAGDRIVLENGLLRREFRVRGGFATVALDNLATGQGLLRAVEPEAILVLDGREQRLGGLLGQPDRAYLAPEWAAAMADDPAAWRMVGHSQGPIAPWLAWRRSRPAPAADWPPRGVHAAFRFEPPDPAQKGLACTVHYDLLDGLPAYAKWFELENGSGRPVRLDGFTSELLAVAEVESNVDTPPPGAWRKPWIHMQSDYSFAGMATGASAPACRWVEDPAYKTQVNYLLRTPALLVSRPPLGPAATLAPGERFCSYRTWTLLLDSGDRERQGLAIRRLDRASAPWVQENPLMMHVREARREVFRAAVDQCAAMAFEMIIYSFGSGIMMEREDADYLRAVKEDVDYAHARGIQVGAYSLLASRHIDDDTDVLDPATGRPGKAIFEDSPCLGTPWARDYFRKVRNFIETTGLDLLEHDGSYPGDVCASTRHPGHQGLADSQWRQWRTITDFYAWCRARGTFLNVPDNYFLNGSSKSAMGYRETNWSLPRDQQLVHARQNIYDGTWEKAPSMGWMFVPLSEYQGGGKAATIEPLREHLDVYEGHLAAALGAGVQACYRGPRLYDSPETAAMLRGWVDWFKAHRAILEADLLHLRRADGRDWDGWLHVAAEGAERGLAMLFNPLAEPIRRSVKLPLHYTGLAGSASVRVAGGAAQTLALDPDEAVTVAVTIPARSQTWVLVSP